MDDRSAEKAIKALNNAGAHKVGTAEGTPVSREHAREIVRAIRKQKRDELAMDDIVTRLREHADEEKKAGAYVLRDALSEAADEIERLRKALALAVHKLILYAPYKDKSQENLIEFFKEAASHD